ncbi:MAG: hypothetical protein GQ569_07325 [Methylococcaceae bacterium]|nr:hypothetical protein [Methylococcaceae bacterium]
MMIHAAINVLLLSVLLLAVGLWRPKYILFWMDEPSRFAIIMIFSVMLISGFTLFGEGSRQKQLEDELVAQQAKKTESDNAVPKINDLPAVDKTAVTEKINTPEPAAIPPVEAVKTAPKTIISEEAVVSEKTAAAVTE